MVLETVLKAVFGDRNERVLKEVRPLVGRIGELEPRFQAMSAEDLRGLTPAFRKRLEAGETVDALLPEAFAAVREAARRTLGQRPFDVQMLGGIVLHQGKIAEMATGEGKTLTACAPAYLNALPAKGVFIVTVNDYLARRDRDWMAPVYGALGMTAGAIQSHMSPGDRHPQYACDLTFGTNSEFGFDYLRDNMKSRREDQVQKHLHYAIVDEVDSILIDEARTPLIISGMPESSTQLYYAADRVARELRAGPDFELKEKEKTCLLTEEGIEHAQQLAGVESFYDGAHMEWPHHLEQALRAHYIYKLDKDYVVQNGEQGPEIIIVDEFTGRLMPGRRWSDGLHQAIEAKEKLRIREELQTLATITYQNYFRLFSKLAGMTGTAMTEAAEFHKIYGLDVVNVPTNRPIVRVDEDDLIYRTGKEKWKALADEIERAHGTGQPLLVGTTSIENSEHLAGILSRRGIRHNVLNAKQHAREAEIVQQAGRKGSVTVATNMAGRGTDIQLGGNVDALVRQRLAELGFPPTAETPPEPELVQGVTAEIKAQVEREKAEVIGLGGLYVIGTERHEARRIDNQLRGRGGRQGDPGRTCVFLSLEDDLMRIFAREWVSKLLERLGMTEGQEIQSGMVSRGIEKAQKRVEARNFEIRKNLLEYDEVMDTQRKTIYGKRQEVLEGGDLKPVILDMMAEIVNSIVGSRIADGTRPDLDGLCQELQAKFATPFAPADFPDLKQPEVVTEKALEKLEGHYAERERQLGPERMRMVERFLLLNTIDARWKDHLRAMDALKSGIGLRGYAQVDPKVEYKREGYEKFQMLLATVAEEVTALLFRLQVKTEDEQRLDDRWQARAMSAPAPAGTSGPSTAAAPRLAAGGGGAALAAMQRGRERAAAAAGQQGPPKPIVRNNQKVGRNDPCPCGSGKKYKHCCFPKYGQ
ncbi:MAG TPA: preprotein translocase subunit SecA [Planctomycetota bacterium]|nr:preprotein translocase subunit SecA [Planctomycetota bacterium]